MTELSPYLFFDGNCADALRFYERTLGAKLEFVMRVGEAPPDVPMPPGMDDKILHARLALAGQALLASDWCTDEPFPARAGVSLSLTYATPDEARRVFNALADGGAVTMPMEKTFWAEAFGMVNDRFGVAWMISARAAA